MKRFIRGTLWLVAAFVPAFLALPQGTARGAGDEDVFRYRAYPNMFIVLERGASMTATDVTVQDVDGDGAANRYDLALKVLFRVLNADGSQIGGHSTPPDRSSVTSYSALIDLDDELFLSQRVGLMYFDNAAHSGASVTSPGGAPFQVYPPDNPPNLPPYRSGSSSWQYRTLWDNVYAFGPPAGVTTIPIPWDSVRACFETATSGDGDGGCRPKVTVLIVTPDAFDEHGHWTSNVVDNTFNPFLLIVGTANQNELRDLIRSSVNLSSGRIAFFASDADVENSTVFANLVGQLQASVFEFVAPVVPAVRSTDNNRLFVASFTPNTGSGSARAFWPGHLISFDLNADGSIPSPIVVNWDAAVRLNSRTAPRRIYTYDNASLQRYEFNTTSTVPGSPPLVTRQMVGVNTDANRDIVVNAVRDLGLGDIFHSTPVFVGAPSRFAGDPASPAARLEFVETFSHRKRLLVAGANDGMFHAFNAGTWNANSTPPGYDAGTGDEEWAYIPGFLVGKVKGFAPLPVGTPSVHNYYVDAPVAVADIWVDSDNTATNAKRASEWHTVAIGGAGQGGKGFFALDITDPSSSAYPAVLWEKTIADSPYIGETWSVPTIGKIRKVQRVGQTDVFYDKWVAVAGGGKASVSGTAQTTAALDLRSVPVVVATLTVDQDISLAPASGNLTLTYQNKTARGTYTSRSGNSFDNVTLTATGNSNKIIYPAGTSYVSWSVTGVEGRAILVMDAYTGAILQTLTHDTLMGPVAASITMTTDSEGYLERGYVGDLQGNVWRVTVDNTGTFSYGGNPFFTITGSGYSNRIYTKAAVAKGAGSYPYTWVYFGTGDRNSPMDTAIKGAVFGVFDSQNFDRRGAMTTTNLTDLNNLTNNSTLLSSPNSNIPLTVAVNKSGWYAILPAAGEKALTSPPAVFNGNLFFTTFQPVTGNCNVGGTARVYGFRVIGNDDALGSFALYGTPTSTSPDTRVIETQNVGIPSAPVVSLGSTGETMLYFGTTGSTVRSLKIPSPTTTKTLKYWREVQ